MIIRAGFGKVQGHQQKARGPMGNLNIGWNESHALRTEPLIGRFEG